MRLRNILIIIIVILTVILEITFYLRMNEIVAMQEASGKSKTISNIKSVQRFEDELLKKKKYCTNLESELLNIKQMHSEARAYFYKSKELLERANTDFTEYRNAFKDGTVTKNDLTNAQRNLDLATQRYSESYKLYQKADNNLKEMTLRTNYCLKK